MQWWVHLSVDKANAPKSRGLVVAIIYTIHAFFRSNVQLLALFWKKICNGQIAFSFRGQISLCPRSCYWLTLTMVPYSAPFFKSWIRHCMYVFTELIFMLCFCIIHVCTILSLNSSYCRKSVWLNKMITPCMGRPYKPILVHNH